MQPEVVQSTALHDDYPASSVLILGEEDAYLSGSNKLNFWLAHIYETTGQGFTLRLDTCARRIAGCQIKNLGKGKSGDWATKEFQVRGSLNENGPWQTLLKGELAEKELGKAASLLNFTFEEPMEVQFLKVDLISYWGTQGGGLQYFSAILAGGKLHENIMIQKLIYFKTKRWACCYNYN